MQVDLLDAYQLEVLVWFNKKRNRWIALAPEVNVTVFGHAREAVIDKLCTELDEEEKAIPLFGPPMMPAEPAPPCAELRRVKRTPSGRWSSP